MTKEKRKYQVPGTGIKVDEMQRGMPVGKRVAELIGEGLLGPEALDAAIIEYLEKQPQLPRDLMHSVENYACQFLRKGRKEWDEPHTRAVVHYAGQIAKSEGEDALVLVTAAWFHDIGYHALFEDEESKDYQKVMDRKERHMVNGARMAREFLEIPGISKRYSERKKDRIVHLISVHDKLEELREKDEIILMEADTLGAIDIEKVATTFDYDSFMSYLSDLYGRRVPRFQTPLGISYFSGLIGPFLAQFKKD